MEEWHVPMSLTTIQDSSKYETFKILVIGEDRDWMLCTFQ